MKRWKLGVIASLAGSMGCQTTTPVESETTQFLGDACTVQAPPSPVWDGSQPPAAGAGKVYIMYAPVNGLSYTALVDTVNTTITYARQVPVGKRSNFLGFSQTNLAGYIVVGGNPPPPPDVIGPTLIFAARRYFDVQPQADADAASCPIAPGPGPIKGGGF